MKKITVLCVLLFAGSVAFAQKYKTSTGKVSFFSSTPMENIEAFNNEVACVVDSKTGAFAFQVPIKSFKFEKQLMKEHFNENYMESDKYAKATFEGKLADMSAVNFEKDGTYNTKASGKLTIHGVLQNVTIPGTITVKGNTITVGSKFKVKPADYKINVPKLVEGKIAKEIEVTVNSIMEQK